MMETILKAAILCVSGIIVLIILICMIANSVKRKKRKRKENQVKEDPVIEEISNTQASENVEKSIISVENSELMKEEVVNEDNSDFELDTLDSVEEDNSDFELDDLGVSPLEIVKEDNDVIAFDPFAPLVENSSEQAQSIDNTSIDVSSQISEQLENNEESNGFESEDMENIQDSKIFPTRTKEFFDEDGIVLIAKGDSRVTGTYGFLPAGDYYVESIDGAEVFKVRTGRNVREYRNGDTIVLVDRHKVLPITASIVIKRK